MHEILYGAPVKEEIEEWITAKTNKLAERGIVPTIATVRVGDDAGEMYYEKSIIRRSEKLGFKSNAVTFADGTPQEEIEDEIRKLNADKEVNAIMLLMPFPKYIDSERMIKLLDPSKDVDANTDASYARLFANKKDAFFACTAESCMEIIRHYEGDMTGKKMTIVGRSLRVGKPLMLMAMNANATVTVCHTRTRKEDLLAACGNADIIVLATGQIESFDSTFFHDGQVIVDVGTGTGSDGKMAGDLNAKELESSGMPENIKYTPVPGGVGTVTTAILLRNVVKAAIAQNNK